MKILYHHRIASKDGQYVHLEEMVNALKKQGNEIVLVGPKIVETSEFGSEGGIVHSLKKHMPQSFYELMEFSYSFFDFFRIMFFIWKEKPDCIYERYNLFFISGIWAKKISGLPFLLEINAPTYEERLKFDGLGLKRLAQWTEKYCWKNADYRLPVTQVLADKVILSSGNKEDIMVIHNGINEERFKIEGQFEDDVDKFKKEMGLNDKFILGFTGFVRDWHGIELVIDVINEYSEKPLHLLLVGDGPARDSLQSYAQKLGVSESMTVTGVIQRDSVGRYVNLFDIALQPAVVSYASPLKMFEYLALGKLIVAPDEANIKEILDDNVNAILFKSGDKQAFKSAVIKAIELNDKEKFRLKAKEVISNKGFTWKENAHRVERLFSQLIG